MKIGIIGTRGIPNHHGGFEQFAQYFSTFLSRRGHDVVVYNSHDHPYKESYYEGVRIIRCYDPEYKVGAVGQFVYDFNCIMDSRKQNFDIILQLGYTSSSIWYFLMPRGSIVVTNMDGLEWKRSKYNKWVQKFLKYAERLAALKSDYLISDSIGIKKYLKDNYNLPSKFIAYGANIVESFDREIIAKYSIQPFNYSLVIARLEPENNIETIIKGYLLSNEKAQLLIFGKVNAYGQALLKNYGADGRLKFLGANYNINELNALRRFAKYYFHGHSVGGTNPSLLEAMSSRCFIVANDNDFNKSVLESNALYFSHHSDISEILNDESNLKLRLKFEQLNIETIKLKYQWQDINSQYEEYLEEVLQT